MTEEQLQVQCFQWHWNTYPNERRMLWHNNNNSWSKIAGNINKSRGVVAGVADFTLLVKGMAIMIELKVIGGKQSEEQIEFNKRCIERGIPYFIIFSFEEFKQLILKIYESQR